MLAPPDSRLRHVQVIMSAMSDTGGTSASMVVSRGIGLGTVGGLIILILVCGGAWEIIPAMKQSCRRPASVSDPLSDGVYLLNAD